MKPSTPHVLAFAAVLLLGAAPAPFFTAFAAEAPKDKDKAQILRASASDVAGTVKFRLTPDAKWDALKDGAVLPVGAEVLTGPGGRARLQMGPGVALVLKPFSRVTLAELAVDGKADEATVRATLAKQYGRVEFEVREAGFKNDFKIASPNGVMAVKGTAGEHDNFGADEWVAGVPANKSHAIDYRNLVAGYRAFLSANEGVSTRFPSAEAFANLLGRLGPAAGATLAGGVANQARGGQHLILGEAEWEQIIQQAQSLADTAPAVRQALENWDNRYPNNGYFFSSGGGLIVNGGTLPNGFTGVTVAPPGTLLIPTGGTFSGVNTNTGGVLPIVPR